MIDLTKLTPDQKKRALCLACERSLLSGQCKCVTPNWVLATTYLPGPHGPINPMPFDKITKMVDVKGVELIKAADIRSGAELAKSYAKASKKQLDKWVLDISPEIKGTLPPGDAPAMASLPFGKKQQLARPSRGNKYHAVRSKSLTTKRWYDSGAERDFRDVLTMLEADGLITEIVEQPLVGLGPDGEIKYKADFTYVELRLCSCREGVRPLHGNHGCALCDSGYIKARQVWVDVKGVETERFKIIKKLWRYNGPGPLEIVKRKGKGHLFLVTQTIMPIT